MLRCIHSIALLLCLGLMIHAQEVGSLSQQDTGGSVMEDRLRAPGDSLGSPGDSLWQMPRFSAPAAWLYLDEALDEPHLWKHQRDSLQQALRRLLQQSRVPYDSAIQLIEDTDMAAIPVKTGKPELVDSMGLRWLNDSMFVVDPQGWNTDLYLKEEVELRYPRDLNTLSLSDSTLLDEKGMLDSTLFMADTIIHLVVDTASLTALEIDLHYYRDGEVDPPLQASGKRMAALSADRQFVEYYAPSDTWIAHEASPFYLLRGQYQLDSLQAAVSALVEFTRQRDSTLIYFSDHYGHLDPFWMGPGHDQSKRIWVKNYDNDSITLWVGNPAHRQISLLLEDEVSVSRMRHEEITYLPYFLEEPDRSLRDMKMLEPMPIYWDYAFNSSLSLSQSYLSKSWTKGGESSFATMIDMLGRATYNNKENQTQWINLARLKFGTLWTESKNGLRVNHDQFEVESRYNRSAWSKIGLSASLYMKHQLAHGKKYFANDSSVTVSKFLNPGTITLGLGAEYKPFEKTTLNMAPISYKTTFVFDTVNIDQTTHGIAADQWARRELGFQVVLRNQFSPFKGLEVTNNARLFSNYLNKPQNIDVDWEIILEQRIAWFFTIRLNLHLIYDDDVRTTVFDNEGNPVLNPDGSEKKSPQLQFKEFVGLALNFKF